MGLQTKRIWMDIPLVSPKKAQKTILVTLDFEVTSDIE